MLCALSALPLASGLGMGFHALRLLIFVLPGTVGSMARAARSRLGLGWAVFLAAVATLAPVMWSKGGWMYGCWLLWPGLYLAATARRKQA